MKRPLLLLLALACCTPRPELSKALQGRASTGDLGNYLNGNYSIAGSTFDAVMLMRRSVALT